jgi:phospholipid/cholesterol/gamma-HCH transport system permease protein
LRRVAAAGATIEQLANFKQTHAEVIGVVRARMDESAIEPVQRRRGALAALGVQAFELRDLLAGHLDFLGRSACELANVALRPHTLRLRALTAQFEQVCLNAIPVVVLVAFLIGVVLAYLLGLQTEQYGANIFVVDGVAIGICRELSPIMVTVIARGAERSRAAYQRDIGKPVL